MNPPEGDSACGGHPCQLRSQGDYHEVWATSRRDAPGNLLLEIRVSESLEVCISVCTQTYGRCPKYYLCKAPKSLRPYWLTRRPRKPAECKWPRSERLGMAGWPSDRDPGAGSNKAGRQPPASTLSTEGLDTGHGPWGSERGMRMRQRPDPSVTKLLSLPIGILVFYDHDYNGRARASTCAAVR